MQIQLRYKKIISYKYLHGQLLFYKEGLQRKALKLILEDNRDSKIEERVYIFLQMSKRQDINPDTLRSVIEHYQPEAIAARLKACEAKLQGLPKPIKSFLEDAALSQAQKEKIKGLFDKVGQLLILLKKTSGSKNRQNQMNLKVS